jgi:hypothetical protein
MTTTNDIQRATVEASAPAAPPRLMLTPTRVDQTILDGGWWPRSWDPVAELPGLIQALDGHFGPIRQVLLNSAAWDSRFRKIAVGPRVVRMGWFSSLDPALVIATTDRGDQIDLLVVPPDTAEEVARRAMARAADPADLTRAPGILADLPAGPTDDVPAGPTDDVPAGPTDDVPAGPTDDVGPGSAWDNEGGHLAGAGATRSG